MFEWFGIYVNDNEIVSAKEFLDQKCLAHSNLKVERDGKLVQVDPPPVSPNVKLGVSAQCQGSEVLEKY